MPKGAPNKKVAMKFLAEISKPEYQANLPFHITYGPTNKKAYEVTTAPKDLIESLPSHPKNVPMMLPVSLDFYAKHRTEALELYMEFGQRFESVGRGVDRVTDSHSRPDQALRSDVRAGFGRPRN
jgi:spermidine/putrescine-binding protein